MMMPKKPNNVPWSDEQWQAIYDDGKNILVSAGAGSGKTSVLTRRIIEKLKAGGSLSRLIVLTFTNASALEMKERIKRTLLNEIKDGTIAQEELNNLKTAHIETFDAFSLYLVKTYHYLLGVSPNVEIIDGSLIKIVKEKFLDEIIEESFNDEDFIDVLDTYTIKDTEPIKKAITNIYSGLLLLPNIDEYLQNYIALYYNDKTIDSFINDYNELIFKKIKKIANIIEEMKKIAYQSNLQKFVEDIEKAYFPLFSCGTYSEVKLLSKIQTVRFPKTEVAISLKEKIQVLNKLLKNKKDDLDEYVEYANVGVMKDEILSTKKTAAVLIRILKRYHERLVNYKRQQNYYEFNDIAQMAIKLLKDNKQLCTRIKENTDEILIDEYQDTSDLQEELIKLIAENNMYMVGDIKQSIYRFRNANPYIFKEKYLQYKKGEGGIVIDLLKNFRSHGDIINAVNSVFGTVMDNQIGGVDYHNGHELAFGYDTYDQTNKQRVAALQYVSDESSRSIQEAHIIAQDIQEKMNKGYVVFDRHKQINRNVEYKDFVILTSDRSSYKDFLKVFDYYKIPLFVHQDSALLKSDEMYVLKNILKAVYSQMDRFYAKDNEKIAVVSILRSFFYSITDDDLYLLCQNFDIDYQNQFTDLFGKIKGLADYASTHSLVEIIMQIYNVFDYYVQSVKLGDVNNVQGRLQFLLGKAYELSSCGYNLKDFIDYLDDIFKHKIDLSFNGMNNLGDVVNIMTIHKSKGLEFPICYYADLPKRFNMQEIKDTFIFNRKYGMLISTFNEGIKKTFLFTLVKENYYEEEVSEKLRLLYVALTRCREQMIIVAPAVEAGKEFLLINRENYRSFYDIFSSLNAFFSSYCEKRNIGEMAIGNLAVPTAKKTDYEILETMPVDVINLERKTGSVIKTRPLDIISKKQLELGNRYHHALEIIDFVHPDFSIIDADLQANVMAFLNHEFIKCLEIEYVYKEHQYSYEENGIINVGTIDLLIETKDEIVIIDYKTYYLSKKYEAQLTSYYNYVSRVTEKKVSAYLYSIEKHQFQKVIS